MKTRNNRNEPSQRQLRMGEQLRHALAEIFTRGESIEAEMVASSIIVSEVRISPDLKYATAYVIPLTGGDSEAEAVAEGLNKCAPAIRKIVSSKLSHIRYTPKFIFRSDTTFDEAQKIDKLLRNPDVARDLSSGDKNSD